jgi:hypothetical protein
MSEFILTLDFADDGGEASDYFGSEVEGIVEITKSREAISVDLDSDSPTQYETVLSCEPSQVTLDVTHCEVVPMWFRRRITGEEYGFVAQASELRVDDGRYLMIYLTEPWY